LLRRDVDVRDDGGVPVDLLVHEALDAVELLAAHGLEMDEVEAQPIGRDKRARLLDMRPEHLAQRRMQQVSGGVGSAARPPGTSALTSAVTMSRSLNVPVVTLT